MDSTPTSAAGEDWVQHASRAAEVYAQVFGFRAPLKCTSYVTESKLIGGFCCCISCESRSECAADASREQGEAGRGGETRRGAGGGG